MTKWLAYSPDGASTEAPFLLARLVSPKDRSRPRKPVFLDAKLDTGSSCCAVPMSAIAYCSNAHIPVQRTLPQEVSGAFESTSRSGCWFHITICPSPAPKASFTEDELLRYFSATPPLYCTLRGDPSDNDQLGLNMVPTIAEYALIGRNVLAHWTVILHGRSSHFKVMDRGGKWFIFSLAPR